MITLKDLVSMNMLNDCAKKCTKQSRWKETTQRYISNMLLNNLNLRNDVLSGTYRISPTTDFKINERGRIRSIEAPAIRDRVLQKSVTKNVLIPNLRKLLIYDNYASLEQRGTSFARKRFEIMLRRYIHRNGVDGYILQIDIKKYFENIDHETLKKMVAPQLKNVSQDVIDAIYYIIDTSSKTDKGVNLGGEPPQILAVYYLNLIDCFVKVVKGAKYYGRYMDDIFVIGKDKGELQELLMEIDEKLSELKLETNKKKTHITSLSHGFTFLQVKYNVLPSGKIIKRLSHKKVVRERRRLKAFKRMLDSGSMTKEEIRNCYKSWRGTVVCEHNACYTTLSRMDNLYNDLFHQDEQEQFVTKRRSGLAKSINRQAVSSDIRYCFT